MAQAIPVLQLIDVLSVGGAEQMAASLTRAMQGGRYVARLCSLVAPADEPVASVVGHVATELIAQGLPVDHLRARRLADGPALGRLRRLIRQHGIRLVHTHLTYADVMGRVAAWLEGVPSVSTVHSAGPVLGRPGIKSRLLGGLALLTARLWAARIVAVSDAAARRYARWVPGRVVTLYNFLEPDKVALPPGFDRTATRRALGLPDEAAVLTTVAHLRPGKGHDHLLAALPSILARHPSVHLLWVGMGSRRPELEAQAAARGLADRVHFAGYRSDVAAILAISDGFVLPSTHEALPTVLLEAMAAGVPVVATRVGGVPEVIAGGQTGWLVPPADPPALAEALCALLSDRTEAARRAEAARQRVEQTFSLAGHVARLEQIYDRVLAET